MSIIYLCLDNIFDVVSIDEFYFYNGISPIVSKFWYKKWKFYKDYKSLMWKNLNEDEKSKYKIYYPFKYNLRFINLDTLFNKYVLNKQKYFIIEGLSINVTKKLLVSIINIIDNDTIYIFGNMHINNKYRYKEFKNFKNIIIIDNINMFNNVQNQNKFENCIIIIDDYNPIIFDHSPSYLEFLLKEKFFNSKLIIINTTMKENIAFDIRKNCQIYIDFEYKNICHIKQNFFIYIYNHTYLLNDSFM